ncbi:hypothetical protein LPJ56_001477 [Coemansia sp. RSA 2599]|nr:hypothetical protein LPJ75_001079 [Coemansia sp. RSA 2598]KAJ1827781.1 hypothetical protein LPJ56_001477 [Coemansia sp. RSA 2599]
MSGLLFRHAESLLLKPANTRALQLVHRRNVSVFLNNQDQQQQQTASAEKNPGTKVGRGLSSIFQSTQPPAPADPHFAVIDSGYGSLVMAKMPPYSLFYTRVGQTLGQSPRARSKAIARGPTSVLRPLLGRQAFLQEISTDSASADVLLAPRQPGDVAVVGLSGAVEYYVRKSCLLARTKFLQVSTWNAIGAAFNALAFDRVAGKGTMVLNTHGGLHRLVLQEGEEYLVDPRYVVAWSANLDVGPQSGRPKPLVPGQSAETQVPSAKQQTASSSYSSNVNPSAAAATGPQVAPLMSNGPSVENKLSWPAPSPTKPAQTVNKTTAALDAKSKLVDDKKPAKPNAVSAFAARLLDTVKSSTRSVLYASANAIRTGGWAAAKTTRTLAGVPDLYRVTGPGEIFVSTRLTPKPWTRITNAISAKSSASE